MKNKKNKVYKQTKEKLGEKEKTKETAQIKEKISDIDIIFDKIIEKFKDEMKTLENKFTDKLNILEVNFDNLNKDFNKKNKQRKGNE